MKTIVPLVAGVTAVTAIGVAMHRGATRAADEAHLRFAATMRAMAERLGIEYRPQADALDWAGAMGNYRGRRVALFLVSQTERSMQTGLSVALRAPPPVALASLGRLRSRKLRVDALPPRVAGADPPAKMADCAGRLLDEADAVEADPARIVVLTSGRPGFLQGLFEYRMETNPERLARVVDLTVDLADGLE